VFVKSITEDNWSGVHNREVEYDCHDLEQVVLAIEKLNGCDKTEVHLLSDAERTFSIGGGNNGRYVAFVTFGVDDEFYNLVDPKQPDGEQFDVVTGGQRGTFHAKQCVSLQAVLEAARQFAIDGTMSHALTWIRQS
jgi:hypothetical protein